jgi:hypothetical protein
VAKGSSKSKERASDARALVDQLGKSGTSEANFNETCTERKHVKNLKKHHPRLRFEIWSGVTVATIVGRDEHAPGAPNDSDQIVRNKNASRNARRLASHARSRASASEPTNNSHGPSESALSPPNESPAPEESVSTSKIVPLRAHLASCF